MKQILVLLAAIIITALSSCTKENNIKPTIPSVTADTVKVDFLTAGYNETIYPAIPPDSVSSARINFQINVRITNQTDSVIYFSYPETYDAFHVEQIGDSMPRTVPISVNAIEDINNVAYRVFSLDAHTSGIVSYNTTISTAIPTSAQYRLQLKEFKYSINGNDNDYESTGIMGGIYHTDWVNP